MGSGFVLATATEREVYGLRRCDAAQPATHSGGRTRDRNRAVPPPPPDLVPRGRGRLRRGDQLSRGPLPILDSNRQRDGDTGSHRQRWNLEGTYRRSFSVLQSVTSDLYTTDTVELTTGGLLNPRTDLRFFGTFATGLTPTASGVADDFRIYGASAQLRFALNATMAATVAYLLLQAPVLESWRSSRRGFLRRYDRNAVRVGLTVWVPLAGTSSPPPLSPR